MTRTAITNRPGFLVVCAALVVGCASSNNPSVTPASTAAASSTASASASSSSDAPLATLVSCIQANAEDCNAKCEAGDMESCVRLAERYRFGDSKLPANKAKAYALLRRACASKIGKACYWGAGADKSTEASQVAAAKPLVVADCDHGDPESCSIEGDLAANEADGNKLHARADDLYGKKCAAGDMNECSMAAGALFAKKDWANAVPLLTRGCDAGDPESCKFLAALYLEGDGVAKDAKRGKELRKKACALGSDAACENLGN
jgi:TPR repeat protein